MNDIERQDNVVVFGNSGTGKSHMARGAGLGRLSVGSTVAAALRHELLEAKGERQLLNLHRQLARLKLLIIEDLGFVGLCRTGGELLFEASSQCYKRGSIMMTTNLTFGEWNEVFGSERLTGSLLDRLTHYMDILEVNGESYHLRRSRENDA